MSPADLATSYDYPDLPEHDPIDAKLFAGMAAASSSHSDLSTNLISFVDRELVEKPPFVKLDRVPELLGQENYGVWEASLTFILKAMELDDIVIEGEKPPTNASKA